MKDKISISLFFSSIVVFLCIGIVIGISVNNSKDDTEEALPIEDKNYLKEEIAQNDVIIHNEPAIQVLQKEETINADTDYVILERDVKTGNIIKNITVIPPKFIGMNREQLIEQLNDLQANPPLSEQERGFVSVELMTFSTSQVQVQMNYEYVEPIGSFYIVAQDHYLVVMQEDKKTVYLMTEIKLSELPHEIQTEIIKGLFIPNEEVLYDFLESYTS